MPEHGPIPARVPDVSVIIPTYQRPQKAAACVATLARQTLPPDRYEVLVGLDGPDEQTRRALRAAWHAAGGVNENLLVVPCERAGLNATRNRLLERARGWVMLSLNDDVLAEPRLIEEHLHAQEHARKRKPAAGESPRTVADGGRVGGACVTGSADWVVPPKSEDSLMDRLVRETSMVFFYDQMRFDAADPDRDWGFRHCWGLNFSAPMWAVRETGGFTAFPLTYGHDDIELAWRLKRRFGMPVWFRPGARVHHDHRYRAGDILQREHNLGVASWRFAAESPEFGLALFGRDITSREEIEYSRAFVQREGPTAERLRETFLSLDRIAADAIPSSVDPGSPGEVIIRALYQQHLLLKRWTWRKGLLDAAGTSGEFEAA